MSSSAACTGEIGDGTPRASSTEDGKAWRESLLVDLRQRIRDVSGPISLYLLTDADDGAVLRIEPAQ